MFENGNHENGTNGTNGELAHQRTRTGRFARGNKLAKGGDHSPGRKYRRAFQAAITPEDIQKVARSMFDAAVNDKDTAAAKMVLEYTLGKPKETIELEKGQTWTDVLLEHARERFGSTTEA